MNNQHVSWDTNADLKLTPEMSFSDLRVRFGTFHYQTIKSPHRENKTVTRNGKMTKLGDIEESVWCRLVKELITREGEEELHSHLLEWCKSFTWLHTQKEVEMEALELHAKPQDSLSVPSSKIHNPAKSLLVNPDNLIASSTSCATKPV